VGESAHLGAALIFLVSRATLFSTPLHPSTGLHHFFETLEVIWKGLGHVGGIARERSANDHSIRRFIRCRGLSISDERGNQGIDKIRPLYEMARLR
jgi:hypothetical protein